MTHDELVKRAYRWLGGCSVAFHELTATTTYGEIPDAIGWLKFNRGTLLIECKATRSDFLSDSKKYFRKNPECGMGDWRIYMCPPEVIWPADLPDGWGLLWAYPKIVKQVARIPVLWRDPPFEGHSKAERAMLLSALRRLKLRGHLEEIYEPLKK